MTGKELSAAIGKEGRWTIHGVRVNVRIIDTRQVWHRTDYLIQPIDGEGQDWVSSDTVHVRWFGV